MTSAAMVVVSAAVSMVAVAVVVALATIVAAAVMVVMLHWMAGAAEVVLEGAEVEVEVAAGVLLPANAEGGEGGGGWLVHVCMYVWSGLRCTR